MTGTVVNALLLLLLVLGAILLIFGPLTALGVMFWHWHKELRESVRLRQARTTQSGELGASPLHATAVNEK